jgi:hypothetical protein
MNRTPKKLVGLNDIMRLKDIYANQNHKQIRQNIIVQKFKNSDLEFIYDQYCCNNIYGAISLPKVH